MQERLISFCEKDTIQSGKRFGEILKENDCVSINGNLGSGKTHFIKGICLGLECDSVALSPTFSLMNKYSGKSTIYHFDFYRIKNESELYDIGFDEYLSMNGIILIEWADLFEQLLPENYYRVQINYLDENKREILIKK